jgi:UDP-2,3-diacylglucosamine pyrophosphatase LpxH
MGEPGEHEKNRARFLEEWAMAKLREVPELKLVILGHTHIPVLREVDPGRYYLNSGDWLTHRSYAVLTTGEPPELVEWEG